jgi:hypothetical protein
MVDGSVKVILWTLFCVTLVGISIYRELFAKRKTRNNWQCPECRFFNEPTTEVCPCGHRSTDEDLGVG